MLSANQGGLLESKIIKQVFGNEAENEDFQDCISFIQKYRDKLFHGNISLIDKNLHLVSHLILKVIYTLCLTVQDKI